MKVAVTGATGFVGRSIIEHAGGEHQFVALVRRAGNGLPGDVKEIETGDLAIQEISPNTLAECDVLINCAARVHVTRETAADPDTAFRVLNSDLPVRLLELAADAGIKRFVHLSSVKAVASETPRGIVVDDTFPPDPRTPYGRSKLEADLRLERRAKELDITTVSLRPSCVFGKGVKAHFRMLMRCAKAGLPLPFGGIENRRSFIFRGNLADAVLSAAASNQQGSYIVADSPPISTAELYRQLLRLYRRAAIVPRLPAAFVRGVGKMALGDRVESLIGDSAFDGGRFARDFRWTPPTDFQSALALTVAEER